jgi:hypothetical protein
MKKIVFLLIVTILFTSACKENMPEIACLSCDDGPPIIIEPQDRRVIIEEFTGVRCVNCPAGSAEIENLLSVYGERLIAVSVHAGFYANPYPESQYDFSTPEGDDIETFLGTPVGYPTSVIDRKLFGTEPDLQLEGTASWGGYVAEELISDVKITLEVDNQWESSNRKLTVGIVGGTIEAINEEVRLTIMITESDIIDTQLTPAGKDNDYVHKHVLRKTITASNGDVVASSLGVGEFVNEEYTFTLPNDWVADNCTVVAFFHNGTTNKEVLQAAEKHVTP